MKYVVIISFVRASNVGRVFSNVYKALTCVLPKMPRFCSSNKFNGIKHAREKWQNIRQVPDVHNYVTSLSVFHMLWIYFLSWRHFFFSSARDLHRFHKKVLFTYESVFTYKETVL